MPKIKRQSCCIFFRYVLLSGVYAKNTHAQQRIARGGPSRAGSTEAEDRRPDRSGSSADGPAGGKTRQADEQRGGCPGQFWRWRRAQKASTQPRSAETNRGGTEKALGCFPQEPEELITCLSITAIRRSGPWRSNGPLQGRYSCVPSEAANENS